MAQAAQQQQFNSYVDFYQTVYGQTVQEVRPAGNLGAAMMVVEQSAGDWSDAPVPDLVVTSLTNGKISVEFDVGAGKQFRRAQPGEFLVVPPKTETSIVIDSAHKLKCLGVPYARLLELAEGSGLRADGDFGHLHTALIRDDNISRLLDDMWHESAQGRPHGSLWFDGALLQLAARLLCLRDGPAAVKASGGLAPRQLKRVQEALDDRIGTDPSLAELAALVDLSPAHLCRAFKASTGVPPHRWLATRRIERAKVLLASSNMPIAEVALAVGYGGQTAFGAAFRAQTGTTPGSYRRQFRAA